MYETRAAGAAEAEFGPVELPALQQRQILLAEQSAGVPGLYNEGCALRLRGPLDRPSIERALNVLVARHAMLGAAFPQTDAEPTLAVGAHTGIRLDDGPPTRPDGERLAGALRWAGGYVEAPFDLRTGPLVRCALAELGHEDHLLVLAVHHAVCDGWSLRLLLREFAECYGGSGPLDPAVPAPYLDFARWQRSTWERREPAAMASHWRECLTGAPPLLELPPDHARPAVKRYRGRRDEFRFAADLRPALARLERTADGSRLAALVATFGALLHHYTGGRDLMIGTGMDIRPGSRFERTVGLFANIVPVRLRLSGVTTVADLLDAACDAVFDAVEYAPVPFEKIVEAARPTRDPGYPPLVQVVCTTWDRDYSRLAFGGVEATLLEVPRSRARFDLMVEHVFDGDVWSVFVEYDTALYEPATVARMARHYQTLVRAAAADPAAALAALDPLEPTDRRATATVVAAPPTPPAEVPPELAVLAEALTTAWREVLETDALAPDDDFFTVGGNSMLAAHTARRVGDRLGVEVHVRAIFENPTVRELTMALAARHPGLRPLSAADGHDIPRDRTPVTRSPVSMAQLQIWINEQLTLGAADDFNSAVAQRLTGPLDTEALRRAIQLAVARHPSLRSRVELVDDLPELRFADEVPLEIPVVRLDHLPPAERPAAALREAREITQRRFDLTRAPLVRALILRLSHEEHVVAYAMHHLVTDGASMAVFHRDVAELYAASIRGRPAELPPLRAHYADYVAWEREWLAGERAAAARDYWRRTLAGVPELALPTAPGTRRVSLAVASCRRTVPPEVEARVAELSRAWGATPFITVTAAFATVLRRWSGQDDLVVGTLLDNRPAGVFQAMTGCFATFVPLRMLCGPHLTFRQFVARARNMVLGAYDHQHLPFSEVLGTVGARREYTRMPLFQTTVQWVGPEQLTLRLDGCASEPVTVTADVSRYELTLFVAADAGRMTLDLEYAVDLWDAETVEGRLARLVDVLDVGTRAPDTPIGGLPA